MHCCCALLLFLQPAAGAESPVRGAGVCGGHLPLLRHCLLSSHLHGPGSNCNGLAGKLPCPTLPCPDLPTLSCTLPLHSAIQLSADNPEQQAALTAAEMLLVDTFG